MRGTAHMYALARRVNGGFMLIVLFTVVALAMSFAPMLNAAEVQGPPTFSPEGPLRVGEERGTELIIRPTRTRIEANVEPHGESTQATFELATSEAGPWHVVETDTVAPETDKPEKNSLEAFAYLRSLTPSTTYYVRVIIKNASGEAEEATQFTTGAIGAPEFLSTAESGKSCPAEIEQNFFEPKAPICGQPRASSARFGFNLYTNGAETSWSAEYSTSRSALESGSGTPISGASGTITVAQEEVEFGGSLSGLTPETTYYLRVKASNEKGTTVPIAKFVTYAQPVAIVGEKSVGSITASSARIKGVVRAKEQETHWYFEYATQADVEAGHWTIGVGGTIPATSSEEKGPDPVEGELTGLSVGTTYYVRLFAENAYGSSTSSEYLGFETPGVPVVTTFPVHAIHGEAMRALGLVALSSGSGDATRYHIDYVTKADYEHAGFAGAKASAEVSLPGGQLEEGSGEIVGHKTILEFPGTVTVGVDLPELQPGESYVYRLAASDSEGAGQGAAQALTVPVVPVGGGEESCPNSALRTGSSAALPSCRAYEQLTPVDKQGATDIFTWGVGGEQDKAWAGEDGNHVLFEGPLTKYGSNSGVLGGGYVFSRREGGHWGTSSITPQPETGFEKYNLLAEGLYNADLTMVGFRSEWGTFTGSSSAQTLRFGPPGGPYTVLPPLSPIGGGGEENKWAGASEDFHTLVLQTTDRRWCGRQTATSSGVDLYEWVQGKCRQLNVDSAGRTIGTCGAKLATGSQTVASKVEEGGTRAVSADGSRVFFTAIPGSSCSGEQHLYMRIAGSTTFDIGAYEYLGADRDGTRVLVNKRNGSGYDFYLYETDTGNLKHLFFVAGTLQGVGGFGYGAAGGTYVSEDLNAVYVHEGLGLYHYDMNEGKLRFLFMMTTEKGDVNTNLNGPFLSPDGRFFYWLSNGNPGIPAPAKQLSPEGGIESGSAAQLYRYDAQEESVECVSCASSYDPEPLLEAITENADLQEADNSVNGVPGIRIASDDGSRAFFVTAAKLVPQDINGEVPREHCFAGCEYPNGSPSYDVYEWRRPGLDGCARVQGCIALVSGGRENLRTQMIGTTPSGNDVFFATHEALVPQDEDSAGDIYDARIGGGETPPPPRPTECNGDACAGVPLVPLDTTPASLSFSGPGNPIALVSGQTTARSRAKTKPCRKSLVRKRGRCTRAKGKAKKATVQRTIHHKGRAHK